MAEAGVIDIAQANADVEEKMARLRSAHHNYDVDAAAKESEELVRQQLAKEGFTEEKMAELDKRIGNSTFSEIAQRAKEEEQDVALLIAAHAEDALDCW